MQKQMKLIGLIMTICCQTTLSYSHETSDLEIEELTEQLFHESTPNIFPHIAVNLQGSSSSWSPWSHTDNADLPLLSVNESIVYKIPTIAKLLALFDNYEVDSSSMENETPDEKKEQKEFLDAVLDTQVMKTAMNFLHKKGYVGVDRRDHFQLLENIWFRMYPRTRGNVGSSGFEHVFLNEMKYGSPIGLHNWIYFHYKENSTGTVHDVDYKGYMKSLLLSDKAQVVKYMFSYKNVTKPVNSMFIGTLPELDMALFTVCFEMDKTYCQVTLDGHRFEIRAFPFYYHGFRMVGATYPVI